MHMHSHAVSLRFEEYALNGATKQLAAPSNYDNDDITVETAAPVCSFQVFPSELHIAPGQEGELHVSFTPEEASCGVYSGALKIRSRSKVHIFLLLFCLISSVCSVIFILLNLFPPRLLFSF
jgi:hypothetical protein